MVLFTVVGGLAFVSLGIVIGVVVSGSRGPNHDGPRPGALFLLIPLGLVMFFVVRALRRTARPIEVLMDATDRVAGGDYSVRIRPTGSDDVFTMMSAFNDMTQRLQANDEQRRLLLADIAHELRNPLAIIRGNVEGMIDGIYPRDEDRLALLVNETVQMSRLLDDLQLLSQAETGTLRLVRSDVDFGALLTDIGQSFQSQAAAKRVILKTNVLRSGTVWIDPVRIRQVVSNIVANAIRHTPPGGRIDLVGTIGAYGIVITVIDNGEGIPADLIDQIFDRFTKTADSGGSGLGLAIAKQLVEAHGGKIAASANPDEGTTIRIVLPILTSLSAGRG
jgi:two-component system sensor histidine kinase BaeS